MNEKITVGKRINKVRKEKKITSDKLAEMIGITPTFLRAIGRGNPRGCSGLLIIAPTN